MEGNERSGGEKREEEGDETSLPDQTTFNLLKERGWNEIA